MSSSLTGTVFCRMMTPWSTCLVDEVDGASRDLGSVVERLLLGVEAGEGRQQRGVDVEDAVGEGAHELGRDEAHVAGQADEIDLVLVEAREHFGIVVGALAAGRGDRDGGEAKLARRGEAGRIVAVGEHDGNLRAEQALLLDGLGDGKEIGATAGEKDAKTFHGNSFRG